MTAANKKFQQLKRRVQAIDAWKTGKDKQTEIKDTFPLCRGTFDTCPSEEDMKVALYQKMAPERCGKCPVFHESKNTPPVMKGKLMTPENEEFYRKMMGK